MESSASLTVSFGTVILNSCCLVAKSCNSLVMPWTIAPQAPLSMGLFPSKNTGVCTHFPLQGIFLTQGSNSYLLHWQVDSLLLSTREARKTSQIIGWDLNLGLPCVREEFYHWTNGRINAVVHWYLLGSVKRQMAGSHLQRETLIQ